MRLRPWQLFRDLSGRATGDMTTLLLRQIEASRDGSEIARQAASEELSTAAARDEIGTVEHAGDEARAALVARLAVTLVTPFDREDMFRVSRSIDDVLDNLRDFVRELDLFEAPDKRFVPVIDAIADGLELLHAAVAGVVDTGADMSAPVMAARKSCNEIRRHYQHQLVHILDGEVDATMLRRRELLRRLDVVGLRLGEAVDALADAVIKRGM